MLRAVEAATGRKIKLAAKTRRNKTYPAVRLVKVERGPRRIILLEPNYVILQELEARKQAIRLSRHCNNNQPPSLHTNKLTAPYRTEKWVSMLPNR